MDTLKREVNVPKEPIKKYRSATITVVDNGFVVSIGCKMIVAETPDKLLALITGYLNDPDKAERDLRNNSHRIDADIQPPYIYNQTIPTVAGAETPLRGIHPGNQDLVNDAAMPERNYGVERGR